MKRWKVLAERVLVEELEVEAMTEQEAYDIAIETDNSKWLVAHDVAWQITSANEIKDEPTKGESK